MTTNLMDKTTVTTWTHKVFEGGIDNEVENIKYYMDRIFSHQSENAKIIEYRTGLVERVMIIHPVEVRPTEPVDE